MKTITLHIAPETEVQLHAAAVEFASRVIDRRCRIDQLAAAHDAVCFDPNCSAIDDIAKARRNIADLETVDRFLADLSTTLKATPAENG